MRTPKIERKKICSVCLGHKEYYRHNPSWKQAKDHSFQPRLETPEEAAYRQGYTTGYEEAADKAHWGPGWD